MITYDVVIVGSGVVGATTALALAKNSQLRIAILEASEISFDWNNKKYDYRVSAISSASKKIFQSLNVWESILQKRISPYKKMHVWDAEGDGEIHFDCADVNESSLGCIIEDSVTRISLLEKICEHTNIDLLFPVKLVSLNQLSDGIELITDSSRFQSSIKAFENWDGKLTTKLLIAADGANSLVRDLASIELKTWDYDHTAIVATVQTELSHHHTAWQRFLPEGPLAFLPLNDEHMCSIVWSTSHEQAKEIVALNDEDFYSALQSAFANKLGKIIDASPRFNFPLRMRHAKNYVQPHLALIGDAAHTIHPLAGQGVNLGLLDAICLADVVLTAIKKNRDFSGLHTLRRYERQRKADNQIMLTGVELLKGLFCNKNKIIKSARNVGLNMTDRFTLLKNYFAHYALGRR